MLPLAASACPLMDEVKGLYKFLDGITGSGKNLGLALVDRALLSEALIQLSTDGWACTHSLLGSCLA